MFVNIWTQDLKTYLLACPFVRCIFVFETCLREKLGQAEYSEALEDVTEALLYMIIRVCT